MNKQEAIEKLKSRVKSHWLDEEIYGDDWIKSVELNVAIGIVNQIDEPEKPVLPQFIADWLEVCKENIGFSLSSAMSHSTSLMKAQPNKVQGWFNLKDNQETWLFGYEFKKEKLYIVEIPNPNSDNHLLLRKNFDGKVCVSLLHSEYWRGNESTRLTEAEIKEGFDWAWQFAKEVEE